MSYLALAKRAEERLKQKGLGHDPQDKSRSTPEAIAVSVLAESSPAEASQILAVWKNLFGMDLDRQRIGRHLEALREWQRRWCR